MMRPRWKRRAVGMRKHSRWKVVLIFAKWAGFVDAGRYYAIKLRCSEIHFHRRPHFSDAARLKGRLMDLFHALSAQDGRLSGLESKLAQFPLQNVDFLFNDSIIDEVGNALVRAQLFHVV